MIDNQKLSAPTSRVPAPFYGTWWRGAATGMRAVLAAFACAALAACGGSGGTQPATVRSTPPPPPPPPPSPPPPLPTNFDTAEFQRSDGPEFHGADAAWRQGATGEGEIIAVIDSGIDIDSREFAGRIHPGSRDVAGSRGIDAEDDHGTNVAAVAAAARNDRGILGIAFDAEVLAIRADRPGSCGMDTPQDPTLNCQFADTDIAEGIDLAIRTSASVVNISLGGGPASERVLSAVRRAADAGIVVVVSAGNAGDGSNADIDPDQPDPFARGLLSAGDGNVIIVGSVDSSGRFSEFSNRAGASAPSFITARGERICCVYEDGEVFVETIGGQQFVTLFSGTSFAAPQVSGAVALLAQAFPNLTGREITEILLDTARDAGAAGIDAVYGTGILDIAAAFRPRGQTILAGTGHALSPADDFAIGSPAMGDALSGASLSTIMTDRYDRAYTLDLGARTRNAAQIQRLRGALALQGIKSATSSEALSLAVTVGEGALAGGLDWARQLRLTPGEAEGARVLAARAAARIGPDMQAGFAFGQGAEVLVAHLQSHERPAFLIAPDAAGEAGVLRTGDLSIATRRTFGEWGVTLSAESGQAWLGERRSAQAPDLDRRERHPTTTLALSLDRQWRGFQTSVSASWLAEDATLLGGYFNPALGVEGADSLFVDARIARDLGAYWRAGGSVRAGSTTPRGGTLIGEGSRIFTNGWSFDLSRRSVFSAADRLGLRVSQPLRVSGGSIRFDLPVGYDYATESAVFGRQNLSLTPDGREVMAELNWGGPIGFAYVAASVLYRSEPSHFVDAPEDIGALVTVHASF